MPHRSPDPNDYNIPWINALLASPGARRIGATDVRQRSSDSINKVLSTVLNTDDTIRSWQEWKLDDEYLIFVSLGDALAGRPGNLHGGVMSFLFDNFAGRIANMEMARPVTLELTVRYKKPAPTSSVILLRFKLDPRQGRKMWMRGVAEGPAGLVYATSDSLWLDTGAAKV